MHDTSMDLRETATVIGAALAMTLFARGAGLQWRIQQLRVMGSSRKGAFSERTIYIVAGAAGFLILLGIFMGVFQPEFITNLAKFAVNTIAAPILNLPFSPVESPY